MKQLEIEVRLLDERTSQRGDTEPQLVLAGPAARTAVITEHDDAKSVHDMLLLDHQLPVGSAVRLAYEKEQHDPADPPAYQRITTVSVVKSVQKYLENGDVRSLPAMLDGGKLPVFLIVPQSTSPLERGSTAGHQQRPLAMPAGPSGGTAMPSDSNAVFATSSGAGVTGNKRRGRPPSQVYMTRAHDLMMHHLIRDEEGHYYKVTDKCGGNEKVRRSLCTCRC